VKVPTKMFKCMLTTFLLVYRQGMKYSLPKRPDPDLLSAYLLLHLALYVWVFRQVKQ